MPRLIKTLFIIIFLSITVESKADSWVDPSWKEMLDSSDLVALVEYTTNGDFRAGAKILTVLKGSLKTGDAIWITGFSNRYGPIDKMSKGDRYLVFLNLNEPDKKRIEYWDKELKEKPELKEYVDAFKNKKAFFVWSPTSGDLEVKGDSVQYDLTGSTYYRKQHYYLLSGFESFIQAYYNKAQSADYCNKLLAALKPVKDEDESIQNIMKLFLLGYDKFDPVFETYVQVNDPDIKYALAQLMGNIKTESSRNILIALLDDKNSLVQGEAVRRLKDAPADIVGPILLKHLQSSSDVNLGPSNIMDPVMNWIGGGKAEIIKTLGALKYKPAIPDLLLLLDTHDEDLFKLVIKTLKNIGTREYIPYINKHLDNKTDNLIFAISMMIAEDSLTECLPAFKNFIATCDRNKHPAHTSTLSTSCGIGHFQDSSTISFLLSDFKRFFTYKDTMEINKQKDWSFEYIKTFTWLKVKEARPLIYRSIFDWCGLNEDFGKDPGLFKVKRKLEDSLHTVFAKGPGKKGYKLDNCIAFIGNTNEVLNGAIPKAKFLIEASVPVIRNGDVHKSIIAKELDLPENDVFIRLSDGSYLLTIEYRFDKRISFTPLAGFFEYAAAVPDARDLAFLQGLVESNFISDKYDVDKIKEAINTIKSALK